jgi:hypothetical protein
MLDDGMGGYNRLPTSSTNASSSGKLPVLSFEYTRSSPTVSSKQPPVDGWSSNPEMACL